MLAFRYVIRNYKLFLDQDTRPGCKHGVSVEEKGDSGGSIGVYVGCPVEPYRCHVEAAVVNLVAGLLDGG